jgi:hypothetical protein
MSDISYEFIYLIAFVVALVILCTASHCMFGDSICSKLKSYCNNNKVEGGDNTVQEI